MKYILCYVYDNWAFFTTQTLEEAHGDDWNDAPYEHNAGPPYQYRKEDALKPWNIYKVAWEGNFNRPCDNYANSPYSVDQINQGAVPWLVSYWRKNISIPAGTDLDKFCDLIREGEGKVYLPLEEL